MLSNKINQLKKVINETDIIKSNIERLLDIYEEKHEEMIKIQNELKTNVISLEKRQKEFTNGICIDYKTFAEIVNVLSIAKSYGYCSEEFFNKVINIGHENEKKAKALIEDKCEDRDHKAVIGGRLPNYLIPTAYIPFVSDMIDENDKDEKTTTKTPSNVASLTDELLLKILNENFKKNIYK